MSPAFDKDTVTYTATTTNTTNKVSATAESKAATVAIKLGDTEIANESSPTWEAGANVLTITVTNGKATKVYTVTVTKS